MAELQLNEIKNGRLAMLAIGGMIHHNWVTGDPLF
jgi:light-harvesting complex I chlorophyll a/b binding protein 1/light-harvesting complex I chlorophyll a/b binding protein 4